MPLPRPAVEPSPDAAPAADSLQDAAASAALAQRYGEYGIRYTPRAAPTATDREIVEPLKLVKAGFFTSVHSLKVRSPEGKVVGAVFKALQPGQPIKIAQRNLAVHAYAGKLGFDVIVPTSLAMFSLDRDGAGAPPRLGVLMGRAKGSPAAKTRLRHLLHPDVVREITKLQWLDHLTGERDRNFGNYFVKVGKDGAVKVSGIDNDSAFRPVASDTAPIAMPPIADTTMADAIARLTNDDIDEMLGDQFDADEVDAAKVRLARTQAHVEGLRHEGSVVAPGDWAREAPGKLKADDSYAVQVQILIRGDR